MIPSKNIDVDTFNAYAGTVQAAALTTTRLAATSLPADLSFHRTIDPVLAHDVDAFSGRVLALASRLVHIASGKTSRICEEEDVMDDFIRNIVDPMEGMLENTDGALDVFLGKRREHTIHIPAAPIDPLLQAKPKKHPFRGRLDPALIHAAHIPKPQILFKHSFSNTDESPYVPATLIPHKWCAKVPLGYIFHEQKPDQDIEDVPEDDGEEEWRKRTLHPYYHELTHPSYPDHLFSPPAEPPLPPSLEPPSSGISSTPQPFAFVSTPKAFLSMANTISSVAELAVDLEHHSYRSYKGFLALMQISTRQGDFVVDLLVPEIREGLRQVKDRSVSESEDARTAGKIIARVFADPSIIKVFHGAESDIIWLQQDFNIFIVGLFDTFHASKLLELPKHSLAHLLETYCGFSPDKRYQLADWRIRPLPIEMLTYARSDTHFLLYIYDMLRLSLMKRLLTAQATCDETCPLTNVKQVHHGHGLIRAVLSRSCRTALRLYENEVYDAEGGRGSGGWDTLARKWNKIALVGSPSQLRAAEDRGSQTAVYKAVHGWREDVAREEDESTRYVLSTHHLFLLAERVPTTVSDLISLFGGPGGVNGSAPPVLKRRAGELVALINGVVKASRSSPMIQDSIEDRRDGSRVALATVLESEATSSTTSQLSAMRRTNESRLWTIPSFSSSSSVSAPSVFRSSLFGISAPGECAQERGVTLPTPLIGEVGNYFATGSMLFGSALTTAASSLAITKTTLSHMRVSDNSAERLRTLTEKIHQSLVIAPVVPTPQVAATVQTQASESVCSGVPMDTGDKGNSAPEASDLVSPSPTGQIEIPFIPIHQRHTLSNSQSLEHEDDRIVVVGQASARQRKRKRGKAGTISALQSKSELTSTSTGNRDREVEEFDYFDVPNLLDNESKPEDGRGAHEEGERKKKKQRHGKGMLTSSLDRHSQGERSTNSPLASNTLFLLAQAASVV